MEDEIFSTLNLLPQNEAFSQDKKLAREKWIMQLFFQENLCYWSILVQSFVHFQACFYARFIFHVVTRFFYSTSIVEKNCPYFLHFAYLLIGLLWSNSWPILLWLVVADNNQWWFLRLLNSCSNLPFSEFSSVGSLLFSSLSIHSSTNKIGKKFSYGGHHSRRRLVSRFVFVMVYTVVSTSFSFVHCFFEFFPSSFNTSLVFISVQIKRINQAYRFPTMCVLSCYSFHYLFTCLCHTVLSIFLSIFVKHQQHLPKPPQIRQVSDCFSHSRIWFYFCPILAGFATRKWTSITTVRRFCILFVFCISSKIDN